MAGRLSLATIGVQDQWLTGEPEFSHFLVNFKKHTKFAFDFVESQFDGDIDFGSTIKCRIPNDKGDLIRNFTLKVTLPDPTPDDGGINDIVWSPSIISHMIDYVELSIGGQVIQKLTGEYIYIHQQLYNTNDDINQTLYFLNGHGYQTLSYQGTYTYYLDIPFYFYRNPSLAIPTCALTKQLVELTIKLRPLSQVVRNVGGDGDGIDDAVADIRKFSVDTEFIYVSDDERNFLMSNPLDYVITQLQLSKFVMEPGETKRSVLLGFKHPVKELFFVSQSDAAVQNNVPTNMNTIERIELRFNNEVVFNRKTKYLCYEQALRHHTNAPLAVSASKFAMYSFALHPELPHPTGQVNMSRIPHKMCTIEIDPVNDTDNNNTRIYAVNYNILRVQWGLAGLKF